MPLVVVVARLVPHSAPVVEEAAGLGGGETAAGPVVWVQVYMSIAVCESSEV